MTNPRWRQILDEGEQRIAPRVTQLVHSDAFAKALGLSIELRRTIESRIEPYSRSLLHALNLPSASDVHRLHGQLADLERDVQALAARRPAPRQRKAANGSPARSRTR